MAEKKTAEQLAAEHTGDNLMNMIIAKTFSRHSKMTEEEFLKDIGFAGSGKTEEQAVRIAVMNVLVETTKQLLMARPSFQTACSVIKDCIGDKEDENVKGE